MDFKADNLNSSKQTFNLTGVREEDGICGSLVGGMHKCELDKTSMHLKLEGSLTKVNN